MREDSGENRFSISAPAEESLSAKVLAPFTVKDVSNLRELYAVIVSDVFGCDSTYADVEVVIEPMSVRFTVKGQTNEVVTTEYAANKWGYAVVKMTCPYRNNPVSGLLDFVTSVIALQGGLKPELLDMGQALRDSVRERRLAMELEDRGFR